MRTDDVHGPVVSAERDSKYWDGGPNDNGEPDYEYGPGAPDEPDDDDTSGNLLPEQSVQINRKHRAKEARRASIENFYRHVNTGSSTGIDSSRPGRRIRRVSFAAGDTFADDITVGFNESEQLRMTKVHQDDDMKYEDGPGASGAGSYEEPNYGYGDGAPDATECSEDGPVEEHIPTLHGQQNVMEATNSRLASTDSSTIKSSSSMASASPASRWGSIQLSDAITSDELKVSKLTRSIDQGSTSGKIHLSDAFQGVRPSMTRWSSGPLHGSNVLGDRKPMEPSRRPSVEKESKPDQALALHSKECGSSRHGSVNAPKLTLSTKFDNNLRRSRRRASIGEAPAHRWVKDAGTGHAPSLSRPEQEIVPTTISKQCRRLSLDQSTTTSLLNNESDHDKTDVNQTDHENNPFRVSSDPRLYTSRAASLKNVIMSTGPSFGDRIDDSAECSCSQTKMITVQLGQRRQTSSSDSKSKRKMVLTPFETSSRITKTQAKRRASIV